MAVFPAGFPDRKSFPEMVRGYRVTPMAQMLVSLGEKRCCPAWTTEEPSTVADCSA